MLAVGLTRGWRSTLLGVGAALLALAVLVAALGPSLSSIPIDVLQLVVGVAAPGLRPAVAAQGDSPRDGTYDDDRTRPSPKSARRRSAGRRHGIDWYSFTLSFKGVFLEMEVAFIVITFGTARENGVGIAAAAAGVALLVVVAAGALVHRPLGRVPENTLKFAVGLMLTTFGTFWATEGAGTSWPGDDAALLPILGFFCLASFAAVRMLRRQRGEAASLLEPRGAEA